MKKPHVLNRSMFNVKGNSAYGRGIASNLVTEEQRIRYNSGGRVGMWWGGGAGRALPYLKKGYDATKAWWKTPSTGFGSGEIGLLKGAGSKLKPFAEGVVSFGKKYPVMSAYGVGTGTSAIGKKRDLSFNPLNWFGGEEEIDTTTDEEKPKSLKEQFGVTEKVTDVVTDHDKVTNVAKIDETDKIDLTPSEKAGLQASMWMSGGAGAMDKKNKNVQDVIRGWLTGAAGAGVKAVDPTVERLWRKRGEASKDTQMAILDKQAQLATSPAAIKAARQKELGVKAAAEEEAFGGQLPTVGSQKKHKQLNELVADSEGEGPKAGPILKDEDTGEILIWNPQTKKYERFSFAEGIEIWNKMRP
jgi:hypothetical protein